MSRIRQLFTGTTLALLLLLSQACAARSLWADDSTTPAACAFIYGNNSGGNRGNLNKILLPSQTNKDTDDDEVVGYFPCNSRNYIINNGNDLDANKNQIGDRHTLIEAYTSTGVPITIAATADWTLNESDKSLRLFFNVCMKYDCATSKENSKKTNYSSPGWNGMLGENFGTTMDLIGQSEAFKIGDDIWLKHDPNLRKQLQDLMSAQFAPTMRAHFGYSEDLFCGSGTVSGWDDPSKPGKGDFRCAPVRITVDKVELGHIDVNDLGPGVTLVNKLRLDNATALYGPGAGAYLAQQDLVEKCKAANTPCVFSVGGTGNTAVALPAPTPTPNSR